MTRPSGLEQSGEASGSRERLADAAATLFRQRGYHGTSVSEILALAGLPKGSLYHHFPNGKADLALVAARRDAAILGNVISQSFAEAESYEHGACTLCHRLAKLMETAAARESCPIAGTLLDNPDRPEFRALAAELLGEWRSIAEEHAMRFGIDQPDERAEHLLILLEGGWALARSEGNGAPFRRIALRGFF